MYHGLIGKFVQKGCKEIQRSIHDKKDTSWSACGWWKFVVILRVLI